MQKIFTWFKELFGPSRLLNCTAYMLAWVTNQVVVICHRKQHIQNQVIIRCDPLRIWNVETKSKLFPSSQFPHSPPEQLKANRCWHIPLLTLTISCCFCHLSGFYSSLSCMLQACCFQPISTMPQSVSALTFPLWPGTYWAEMVASRVFIYYYVKGDNLLLHFSLLQWNSLF